MTIVILSTLTEFLTLDRTRIKIGKPHHKNQEKRYSLPFHGTRRTSGKETSNANRYLAPNRTKSIAWTT
ncbi:MAG: hypothetical protein PF489_10195 [Salinivirgaceae bacterium]|nr:hypothetical protein [Salinivirgaceae bacterium]